MGTAGRPAKPSELKVLQGTARADRMPKNPIKSQRLLKRPNKIPDTVITEVGKKKFKEICDILLFEGRLFIPDLELIERYAGAYEMYHKAKFKLEGNDYPFENMVIEQTNQAGSSYETLTQWKKVYDQEEKKLSVLANDLGLTPKSRATTGNGNSGNPLRSLMDARKNKE
ncbi:P27 family phage terminase small subunit [Emticicia fontis]